MARNLNDLKKTDSDSIQEVAVSTTAPADTQVLAYNAGAGEYEPTNPSGGGSTTVFNASWEYDSTVTKADPGAGKFRLDNATMASVTEMYIDDLDKAGIDMGSWISRLADGIHLRMGQSDDAAAGALFVVGGTPVDETGYWTIPVSHVADGTSGLTNAKTYGFQFEGGGTSTAGSGIPTEEYRADSPAGLATSSNLVYFTNVRDNTISQFGTITNDSTDGWTFTASRECEVVLSGSLGFGGGVASFGFTYNEVAGDKNVGIGSLSAGKHLGFTSANVAGWARNIATTKILQANDVIKFHVQNNEVPYTNAQFGLQMTVRDVEGGGWNTVEKTSAYTATNYDEVMGDTATTGAFTVTLPASPTNGTRVRVIDSASNWATANLTVGRNGKTIRGAGEDLVCDVDDAWVELIWNNNDSDWDLMTP